MVGHTTLRSAQLWVQLKSPGKVRFEVWEEASPEKIVRSEEVAATAENAGIAKATVYPLEAGKSYLGAVVHEGRRVALAHPFRFRTPVFWQHRSDPPNFTVAAGSCVFVNETADDRPGKPYGGEYAIFQAIANKRPDVMVWLGDTIYLREPDFGSRAGIVHRWTHGRSLPDLQPLLSSAAHYFIWDDHDYGPNDSDRSYSEKGITRAVFELFTANPPSALPEHPRLITNRFEWGDVEFFLTDDRTDRAPNKRTTGERPYLGRDQLRWLIDALVGSTATFKIICVGNQVLNDGPSDGIEGYSLYREEHRELLEALQRERIRGVLFLTGDRHAAELTRVERPGTYPLYDLTTSPLTSGVSDRMLKDKNTGRVEGTMLLERNFALLRFSGPRSARVLTLQVCKTDGSVAWERKIEAKELR
ncbi:MAG: alkaline phosphatase D family protein [Verrucomicrobia bacterium]|nr:alkaline phosphatase D family protein [Verrucomicrobiota bacterium]